MEQIDNVKIDELVKQATVEIVSEKKANAIRLIKGMLIRREALSHDVKSLKNKLKSKEEKIKKIEDKISRIQAGDWSLLKEDQGTN